MKLRPAVPKAVWLLPFCLGLTVLPRAGGAPGMDEWFAAAKRGEVRMIGNLLAQGADINSLDTEGVTALFHAVDFGQDEAALYLAGKGAEVDRTGPGQPTPLAIGALRGNGTIVRALLDRGANPNAKVDFSAVYPTVTWQARVSATEKVLQRKFPGYPVFEREEILTPLCLAATGNRVEAVAALIEHGAKVNFANALGMTPLSYSARRGAVRIVELLLQKGADLRENIDAAQTAAEASGDSEAAVLIVKGRRSAGGQNPLSKELFDAVGRGQYERVGALIYKGANVNATNEWGITPVCRANAEIARVLMDHGANSDVTPPPGFGFHPLWRAVDEGSIELIEVLAAKGIRREQLDSLLIFSAQRGQAGMARWLLDRGANPNARDEAGYNALVYALSECRDEVADLLRKAGSASIAPDRKKLTNPLFDALDRRDLARVKLLLARGVDPNWPNSRGYTPLGEILGMRSLQKTRGTLYHAGAVLLLEHGARAGSTVVDFQDFPVIYNAIEAGDLEVVKLMVQQGADPNEPNPPGPLIDAVTIDVPDIVRFLLEKKVDVNRKDQKGRTPLALALAIGNQEIIAMLRKAGAHE